MLGTLKPRRPSASAGLAAAPMFEFILGSDSRPPTAVTLLSVLVSPEVAPWAESTTAESASGATEPVDTGVASEIEGTVFVCGSPVLETLTFGTVMFSADTDELDVSGDSALLAEEVPTLGSVLATPLSAATMTLRRAPFWPRPTLTADVCAWVVPL